MPTATINGIDVYFERGGEGPPVLFLNGSGATLAAAAPLIDRLRSSLDVVAHDQRGLGRTQVPRRARTRWPTTRPTRSPCMDHVGWTTCRVVGVSFGGMVAQELAVTAPDRVERLALVCTSPGGVGGASYPLHELASLTDEERAAISVPLLDTRFTPEWLAEHPLDAAIVDARGRVRDRSRTEQRYRRARAARGPPASRRVIAPRRASPARRSSRTASTTASPRRRTASTSPQHIANAELRGYEGGHLFFIQDHTALPDVIGFLAEP